MNKNLKIGEGAIVCQEAIIIGDVTIGKNTIIHPKVTILAESAPIIIGSNNIIEELVIIKNSYVEDIPIDKQIPKILTIGNNNIFEVGTKIEAQIIGNNNKIETNVYIGKNAVIGNGCIIGKTIKISPQEIIEDFSIIWQNTFGIQKRIDKKQYEYHLHTHLKHLEILSKTLPNFHHLQKSNTICE